MTQFQPPPPPMPYPPQGAAGPDTSRRWSASAIAGFVLSLLGCTGIGAILGLILGVVGIFATRDGRRRGLGLAIAAIPISLLTGAMSVVIGMGLVVSAGMMTVLAKLPELLNVDASGVADLRELTTDAFDSAVTDQELRTWLEQLGQEHGKLMGIFEGARPTTRKQDGRIVFSIPGKFVNGNADISIAFAYESFRSLKVDDIQVDGVSPRTPD